MRPGKNWLRHNNVSAADLLLVIGVGGGLLASVLRPSNIATFVEPTAWFFDHELAVVTVFAIAVTVAIGRFAATWGPVRVELAALKWTMSGPHSRAGALRRKLAVAAVASVGAAVCLHRMLALVLPDSAILVIVIGAVSGLVAVTVAYTTQLVKDARRGSGPNTLRAGVSPGRLHRRTFAPRDGFSGAVGLAVTMMDPSWIADARVTRWQSRSSARHRPLLGGPLGVFVRMDLRRFARHPEVVIRWLSWTTVGVLMPVLLEFHAVPMLLPVLTVWMASIAASGGLASSASAILARSFGISDRQLQRCHAVVPALCTVASSIAVSLAAGLNPVVALAMTIGLVVAVFRRATRPPLPFDAPAMTDMVTGAAFQPTLLTAQLRGLLLAVAVGIVAGLLV